MKTIALIEKSKDGSFGIFTPNLESTIIGSGSTVEEAKSDFENSVIEVIQAYKEFNEKLPNELVDISFEYKFDIASLFNYFDFINVTRLAKRIGLNPSLLRQYKLGGTYISESQAKRIEDYLHQFANELLAVHL